jgi:hypothetical protein
MRRQQGQPAAYTLRQLHDFRNGLRMSADRRKPNTATMVGLALAMSEKEMQEAAGLLRGNAVDAVDRGDRDRPRARARARNGQHVHRQRERAHGANRRRIIETPRDEHQANVVRNPRSGGSPTFRPAALRKARSW